eukprot:UN01169
MLHFNTVLRYAHQHNNVLFRPPNFEEANDGDVLHVNQQEQVTFTQIVTINQFKHLSSDNSQLACRYSGAASNSQEGSCCCYQSW